MTYSASKVEQILNIKSVKEPNIVNYFTTINQGKFKKTAALFVEDGELLAPFEQPIKGRKAISSYLTKEATAMNLVPKQAIYQVSEDNLKKVKVTGKVKTPYFTVNVAWYFSLNSNQQIIAAKIKLLASPQELLGLQQKHRY